MHRQLKWRIISASTTVSGEPVGVDITAAVIAPTATAAMGRFKEHVGPTVHVLSVEPVPAGGPR